MKVLITGCAGFIGSNLTDHLLNEGYNVCGIDCFTDYYSEELKKRNISSATKNKRFKLIRKDLLDMDEYPQVDYVFHMAAQAGVRASWGENFNTYTKNNVNATQKLLEFYKDSEIKKFIYSSSSSVYGDSKLPMNEKNLLKPVSPYGVTKLAGENLCYLYWKNYGVPTVSLRYFTVYGPRQRPDMAIHKFMDAIQKDRVINVYGNGNQTRDFTYVDDIVKALFLAAKSNVEGEIFNVGGGSRISVNNLLKEMEIIIGKKAVIKYMDKQRGDVKDTLADLNHIKKLLGWEPETDIKNGLENYFNYLENID